MKFSENSVGDLGAQFLTTRQLAELLHIKERKVYELASESDIPCSRATGKLLFPRNAIEKWLSKKSNGLEILESNVRPTVFLGSQDPLLEWAILESRCGIATTFDGSLDGITRFKAREGIATGLHLYDADNDNWNTHLIQQDFARQPVVLIEFAKRQRGFIFGRLNKLHANYNIRALLNKVVVQRQPESGSQILFGQLLKQEEIDSKELQFTPIIRSEQDAALAVLEGHAEVAFGLRALADKFQLNFFPVITERFDLLVDRRAWFEAPFQQFIDFCNTNAFCEKARQLDGYDISGNGHVLFNGG